MSAKKKISTTVDIDVWRKAKAKRERTGRSLAHVINTALRQWVEDDPPPARKKEGTT